MKNFSKALSCVLAIGLLFNSSIIVKAEEVVVNQSTSGQYSYTIPATGTYKIEAWGAQGGNYSDKKGGLGGKAEATYKFNKGDVLNYYVGGSGSYSKTGNYTGGSGGSSGSAGGGASVVDIGNSTLIVAGGGGGANRDFSGLDGGSISSFTSGNSQGGRGGGYTVGNNGGTLNIDLPYFVANPRVSYVDAQGRNVYLYHAEGNEFQPNMDDIRNYDVYSNREGEWFTGHGFPDWWPCSVNNNYGNNVLVGYTAGGVEYPNAGMSFFSGWQGVEDSKAFTFQVRFGGGERYLQSSIPYDKNSSTAAISPEYVIDPSPYDKPFNLDSTRAIIVDQNNNVLDSVTLREIINGKIGSKKGYSWNGWPQNDMGPDGTQTGVVYINSNYAYSNTLLVPNGVTKIGIYVYFEYTDRASSENSKWCNSGFGLDYFYGSKTGHEASGGGSYINSGYSCENSSSTVGVKSGDGTIKITKLITNFDITYDLHGGSLGSGVSNPSTYTEYDASFTLNNPTRTGYTFLGWTGNNQTKKTTMTIPTGTTGNLHFDAVWKANTYEIRVYPNTPSDASSSLQRKK